MFTEEVRALLWEVITSWQVIVTTIVLVIYVSIVNYAARAYRKGPRRFSMPRIKRKDKVIEEPAEADSADSEEFTEEEEEESEVIPKKRRK